MPCRVNNKCKLHLPSNTAWPCAYSLLPVHHHAVKCNRYEADVQVDLCHGPHLPNTGLLKASAVNAVNRAHWRADVNNEPLQVSHC